MEHVDVGLSTRLKVDPANPPKMSDDAYPAVFNDQRTMLQGGRTCEDGADVFWNCWARHLEQHQPGLLPHLDEDNRDVVPYLNAGRWVADCPACGCGMACWDENPYTCCLGWACGRMFKVRWQPPQDRSEVMRLLAGWPEGNRNWDAHKGETIEELKIQGVLMAGVEPAQRNGLLVAANVHLPDELTDPGEYLDKLRRERRNESLAQLDQLGSLRRR